MLTLLQCTLPLQDQNTLLILNEPNGYVMRSGRNVEKLAINVIGGPAGGIKIYDVLRADRIVVEKSALAYINEFYGQESAAAEPTAASE